MSFTDTADRFLALSDSLSGTGRWWFDTRSQAVNFSPEVWRVHALEPDCAPAGFSVLTDLYTPEDQAKFTQGLRRALSEGQGFELELQLRSAERGVSHVQCRCACTRGENGDLEAIVGVFQNITHQKQILTSVTDSEIKYRLLADHMSDAVARINLDGTAGYISPAIEKILGYRPEEIKLQALDRFVHPDDSAILRQNLVELVQGQRDITLECRALHKDGHVVWVEARASLALGDGPGAANIVVVIRDISERRATQEAVAQSLARYRLLTENSRDAVIQYDAQGQLQYASPAFFIMLGYETCVLTGERVERFLHPDDIDCARKAFADALTEGAAVRAQYRLFHKDGRLVWVEAGPMVVRDPVTGVPIGATDVLRDITDRKRAEAELEKTQYQYRLLADNAADIISRAAPDGRQIYMSPSVKTVLGYEPEELVGLKSYEFIHPDDHDRIAKEFARYAAAGPDSEPARVEFRAIRKDGAVRWLESHSRADFDEHGRVVEFHDISRDVTDRKLLEEALEQARAAAEVAMATKAEFISNVSHELRTPLTSILGFSAMLSQEEALSERARLLIDRVNQSGQALLAQVDDILDFSKLESGLISLDARPTDLRSILGGAVSMLEVQASKKDLALGFVEMTELPDLGLIDEGRLRQVLLNLISNAVKFTSAGTVELKAHYDFARSRLRCEVTDTGPGIPEDRLERLFKRFSQVDASTTRLFGGTGLGLAICKGLVDAMGGEIGVSTTVGRGSCFWIDLPCPPAGLGAQLEGEADAGDEPDLSGLRLLVVDDHAVNRELVRLILEPFALEISEAASGAEAIAILDQCAFDVVLMDIRMPDMNGIQAAERIRAREGPNREVCILAFSADAVSATVEDGWSGIFDGSIAKPFVISDIVSTIYRSASGNIARRFLAVQN